MKDGHIVALLEENKLKDMSEAEFGSIEAHAAACADCRREYEAAKAASAMLRARAAQTLEPTPFFEARVMNAWRERQAQLSAGAKPVTDRLRQMWQDARLLVSGMATTVAMLLVLTLVAPVTEETGGQATAAAAADDYYSVESVVFDSPEAAAESLTDAELIREIYAADELEN